MASIASTTTPHSCSAILKNKLQWQEYLLDKIVEPVVSDVLPQSTYLHQSWNCKLCSVDDIDFDSILYDYRKTKATHHRHSKNRHLPLCLCVPLTEMPKYDVPKDDIIVIYRQLQELLQQPIIYGIRHCVQEVDFCVARKYLSHIHSQTGTHGYWRAASKVTLLADAAEHLPPVTTDANIINEARIDACYWRFGGFSTQHKFVNFVPFAVIRYDCDVQWPLPN